VLQGAVGGGNWGGLSDSAYERVRRWATWRQAGCKLGLLLHQVNEAERGELKNWGAR